MQRSLKRAFSIDDLERLASRKLARAVYDFYAGGAEDEACMHRNRAAFGRLELVPRILAGVSDVQLESRLLGAPAGMPLAIAPMGAVGFGRRGGDLELARAAAVARVPYVLSTTGTASIERIASDAGGRLWFQLYPLRRREVSEKLVQRAQAAGYEALVVTVDVPVGGKRERDLRNDFAMPFRFTPRNMLGFAMRPRWALDMLIRGVPTLENLAQLTGDDSTAHSLARSSSNASSVGGEFDMSFRWSDLASIRSQWKGKLLIKGVLHPEDALRAVEHGCDAVIVSNHGGRQLDSAPSPVSVLPEVVQAVGGRAEVWVDGGIRRGADIVKARALGATGVLVGRPLLWGVCAGGEEGATRALSIFRDEMSKTLHLCGIGSIEAIDSSLLRTSPALV